MNHPQMRSLLSLCVAFAISGSTSVTAAPFQDAASPGSQASWRQWRGPNNDNTSLETNWRSKGEAKALWEIEVGRGYSGVTVQDGLVYTIGHQEDDEVDLIFCIDGETGETVWDMAFPCKIWNQFHGGGSLTTPTLEGDKLYCLSREGMFHCLDSRTGEVLWSKHYGEELKLKPPTWGFSASPLLVDDQLILNLGKFLSIDKKNGKVLWSTKRNYDEAYSVPTPFNYEGKQCLAIFNGGGVGVIERKGGKELCLAPWKTKYGINAASPIVIDDKIFISSGYNHGCGMFKIVKGKLKTVWESKVLRSQLTGPVLIGDHLYGFDDSTLKCIDLDGKEMWRVRGSGKGALTASADGRLIVLNGKGELQIGKASPTAYEPEYKQKVLRGGVFWTSPVLCDGKIYCRSSLGGLICRDHSAN